MKTCFSEVKLMKKIRTPPLCANFKNKKHPPPNFRGRTMCIHAYIYINQYLKK